MENPEDEANGFSQTLHKEKEGLGCLSKMKRTLQAENIPPWANIPYRNRFAKTVSCEEMTII